MVHSTSRGTHLSQGSSRCRLWPEVQTQHRTISAVLKPRRRKKDHEELPAGRSVVNACESRSFPSRFSSSLRRRRDRTACVFAFAAQYDGKIRPFWSLRRQGSLGNIHVAPGRDGTPLRSVAFTTCEAGWLAVLFDGSRAKHLMGRQMFQHCFL